MEVTQFVMAYGVEQDRLRALLPDGFSSLRPVIRINAEIRDNIMGYLECNIPVESQGKRGWLNVARWEAVPFVREEHTICFRLDHLTITFTPVGISGSCPAEKDNDGCFFMQGPVSFRPAEQILANKEFCDCSFSWHFHEGDANGKSIGKTLPAFFTEVKKQYPKQPLTAENIAAIPCGQVLGTYMVSFQRKSSL